MSTLIKLPAVITAILAAMFLPAFAQAQDKARESSSGEFQPDENTLFLAHYNTMLDADYSQGGAKHEQMDAGYLTGRGGGYFGEGLVGRVGTEALQESGARIETSLFPTRAFDGLRYPSPGNLDLERGTFECWVKPCFSAKRAEKMPAAWPIIYVLFAYTETAGKSLTVCFNQYSSGDIIPHFAIAGGKKSPHVDISGGRIDWQPGAWHHIAVTWDNTPKPGQGALFLDGKKVAEKSFAPLEDGFLKQTGQFPYFSIGSNLWRRSGNEFQFFKIDAVVDEVRISNIARYRENFIPISSPNH